MKIKAGSGAQEGEGPRILLGQKEGGKHRLKGFRDSLFSFCKFLAKKFINI